MPFTVTWEGSEALWRRLAAIADAARPDSRAVRALKRDVAAVVIDDHEEKLLVRSVDRYGRGLAPLAASTLRDKRRAPGPALAPGYARSRFLSTFRVRWHREGAVWVLDAGWWGFTSPRGFAIPLAHRDGVAGRLPRRDTGGVTPKGWTRIRDAFREFEHRLTRARSS